MPVISLTDAELTAAAFNVTLTPLQMVVSLFIMLAVHDEGGVVIILESQEL